MIDDVFLRHSIRDINNGLKVYIYNEKFIEPIKNEYFKKYKTTIDVSQVKEYFVLSKRSDKKC